MKIAVKKLHCSKCERLIHVKEQRAEGVLRLSCTRCGSLLRTWDGIKWLPVRPE